MNSTGKAICQEFSDEVKAGKSGELNSLSCILKTKYLTSLIQRMAEVGYCCIKAQRKGSPKKECEALFQEATEDNYEEF